MSKKSKVHESDESYVPLSRGIRRYLRTYSLGAQALYTWILTGADWRSGDDYGVISTTISELSDGLGASGNSIRKYLHELSNGWPLSMLSRSGKTAPPFVEITSTGQKRAQALRIRIIKAKMSAICFKKNGQNERNDNQPRKTRKKKPSEPEIINPDTIEEEIEDHVQGLIDQIVRHSNVRKERK